ncbi:PTS glucitol/sorbitol transporter subunit IIA [Lactiplantibacillus daowaiensis]|uniref:PTS glucitol/sorbitol transporter subunit IIA n=1 Tax=Lactiplantibacillus daowaiensis TaxID=2559918 RepID=A0ABW1S0K9_9LACO|nr:PTS glucitol/sorbitol transporter subunit IIA [Lactiplantibacillus daowaiensis]
METNKNVAYQTVVKEIGNEALDFAEIKMVIFFGDEAPDALRPSCYIVDVNPIDGEIKPGMFLIIDDESYQVTAVGNEVQRNLQNLGHIAVSFTGETKAGLAGTMYVEDKAYPQIKVGSQVSIQNEI